MEFHGIGGYFAVYLMRYGIAIIRRGGVVLVNAGKCAVSVLLHLPVSGVSSGKRSVAEVGFRVRRREPMATKLGLGVSGVCPVVGGGGMVANRRRGETLLLLCWIGVSVDVCFSVFVVTMDGPLTDLASAGRRN